MLAIWVSSTMIDAPTNDISSHSSIETTTFYKPFSLEPCNTTCLELWSFTKNEPEWNSTKTSLLVQSFQTEKRLQVVLGVWSTILT